VLFIYAGRAAISPPRSELCARPRFPPPFERHVCAWASALWWAAHPDDASFKALPDPDCDALFEHVRSQELAQRLVADRGALKLTLPPPPRLTPPPPLPAPPPPPSPPEATRLRPGGRRTAMCIY
jgi:hypothetical protein